MSELGMLKSSDGAERSVDFSSAIEPIQRLLGSREDGVLAVII